MTLMNSSMKQTKLKMPSELPATSAAESKVSLHLTLARMHKERFVETWGFLFLKETLSNWNASESGHKARYGWGIISCRKKLEGMEVFNLKRGASVERGQLLKKARRSLPWRSAAGAYSRGLGRQGQGRGSAVCVWPAICTQCPGSSRWLFRVPCQLRRSRVDKRLHPAKGIWSETHVRKAHQQEEPSNNITGPLRKEPFSCHW